MIGAQEVIKCECEHLIHSTLPLPPGTDQWDGGQEKRPKRSPRLPSKWGCAQCLIHKGEQKAEDRLGPEMQGPTWNQWPLQAPGSPDMLASWGDSPVRSPTVQALAKAGGQGHCAGTSLCCQGTRLQEVGSPGFTRKACNSKEHSWNQK